MAVVFAIFGILHFLLFVSCSTLFFTLYRKRIVSKPEVINFFSALVVGTIIGFFVTNHFAMNIKDGSVMLAIGYSIVPITQASLVFVSYVVTTYKAEIKFSPLILGLCCSAPMTFLATGLLGRHYWDLVGRSIYG